MGTETKSAPNRTFDLHLMVPTDSAPKRQTRMRFGAARMSIRLSPDWTEGYGCVGIQQHTVGALWRPQHSDYSFFSALNQFMTDDRDELSQ